MSVSIGLCDQKRKALGWVLENLDFGFSCALWLTQMVTFKMHLSFFEHVLSANNSFNPL